MLRPALLIALAAAAAAERPLNVLLILADDLGWMDLSCQGNRRLSTPNVDRLASEGLRFTDAYAAAPVCSPTRASILTGLSPARLHITNHIPDRPSFVPDDASLLPAAMLDHLPLEHVTLAEHLRRAGYATGFFGKWHLSGRTAPGDQGRGQVEFAPEAQGFDRNVGGCALGGPPTYFDPYRIHNVPPREEGEYLPDRLADEVVAFLRAPREGPFFACLWSYAVHWPMEAPAELVEKYEGRSGPARLEDPRYGAMIEAWDAALGRILDEITWGRGKEETLVILTSDNGPFLGVSDAAPLRSGKGYLYEGGIRVPMIVYWPDIPPPIRFTCDVPVITTDLFPTVLEIAGCALPEHALDGESLVPLLRNVRPPEREALFFHYPNYAWHKSNRLGGAVRAGKYKLIHWYDDDSLELYDLEADLGETTDLSERLPEVAADLDRRLLGWLEETGAAMPTRRER